MATFRGQTIERPRIVTGDQLGDRPVVLLDRDLDIATTTVRKPPIAPLEKANVVAELKGVRGAGCYRMLECNPYIVQAAKRLRRRSIAVCARSRPLSRRRGFVAKSGKPFATDVIGRMLAVSWGGGRVRNCGLSKQHQAARRILSSRTVSRALAAQETRELRLPCFCHSVASVRFPGVNDEW
jgi:hypothetical protein